MRYKRKIKYYLLLAIGCILLAYSAQAAGITLTWTTDTYTPLDYQGMALPSRGSNIEVAVQFNSPGFNPQDLTFNWFLNDHIQKQSSGKNKQVFKFNIGESITKNNLVKVEIIDKNGFKIETSDNLPLKARQPEIVLKAKNPPLKFSDQYQFSSDQEIEFTAQPYFFNIKDINELNYQWKFGSDVAPQVDNTNLNNFILKVGKLNKMLKRTLQIWVENKNNLIQRTQSIADIILIP